MTHETAIRVREVSFRYADAERSALDRVSVEIEGGGHVVIAGPNGAGKSTLLRCMLGRLRPESGAVVVLGRPVRDWPPRELARCVGVVPQEEHWIFPLAVEEVVSLGRYPHLGAWRQPGAADRGAVERALERCDVVALRKRRVDALSGGERQRVRIARALAQEPRILVLDEPTIHLDVRHEMEIFELVRGLIAESALTVVTVTHNLNLAARYADRLALLHRGRVAAEGPPSAILTPPRLADVFDWPIAVERDSRGRLLLVPESGIHDGPESAVRGTLGASARHADREKP